MKRLAITLASFVILLSLAASRASASLCSTCAYITGEDATGTNGVIYSWDTVTNNVTPALTVSNVKGIDSLIFVNGKIVFDSDNTQQIFIYDPATQTSALLANLAPLGASSIADLTLEPSGTSILVSSRGTGKIYRVNLSNGQATVSFPAPGTSATQTDGLVYDNESPPKLFASLHALNSVAQLDPATGQIIKSLAGITQPDGLTFNSATGKLYVGSNNAGFYTVDTALTQAVFTDMSATVPAHEQVDGVGTTGHFLYLIHWIGSCTSSDCGFAIQFDLNTMQVVQVSPHINGADDIAPLSGLGSLGPNLTSLAPNTIAANSPAFTLTVNGSNFAAGAVVTWNGSNRATTFVSSSQLTAAISAADVASPATINVGVTNPDNQTSGTLPFTVTSTTPPPPTPVLTSIRVSPQVANLTTGGTVQFLATGFDQNGNTIAFSGPLVWTNDNNPPNSINATGLYQAGSSVGTDVVRATNQGIQGTANVTITSVTLPPPPPPNQPPVLTSIRISPKSATVGTTLQIQFNATAYDQYGSLMILATPYVWSNLNNPPNAIDLNGLYQAGSSAGTDTVTVSNQGMQDAASVTITSAPPPPPPPPPGHRHLVISPHHASMHVGDTLPFTTLSVDDLGNSVPVTPTYNVVGAGAMSATGVLTALNTAPSASITATYANNDPDTATVDILAVGAMTDISTAKAYPVPFKSTQGIPGITFANLAPGTRIRIFATNAKELRSLTSVLGETVVWDVRNSDGSRVASGVYFYIIDNVNTHQTVKGKVVIIQ